MAKKIDGKLKIGIFVLAVIVALTMLGVFENYRSGDGLVFKTACAGDECAVDSECDPCQECKDQYPDKPFEVLGCSDICASGEECIDDDCCPEERACDDVCCAEGSECIDDGCCPEEQACDDSCCDEEAECIDDECCPEDRACGDECCPEGYICLN
jgi:hypothetical protein